MKTTTLKLLLLAGFALGCGQALAQDGVLAESLTFAGSGCKPSSGLTGQLVDTDHDGFPDRFNVRFSGFVARQGSGLSISNRLRNCTMTVGLDVPAGWQFGISGVRVFGHASLPAGVFGRARSEHEFPLWSNKVTRQMVLTGPYSADYVLDQGIASIVWSRCERDTPLEIETQVAIGGNRALPARVTAARQIYSLKWRRCS